MFTDNLSFFCCSFHATESCRMPHILQYQKFSATGMLERGMCMSATVGQFGVSRQNFRLWLHHYQMTGAVSDLPCSGHPQVMTQQQDFTLTTAMWNPLQTSSSSHPWVEEHPTGVNEACYPIHEAHMSSCDWCTWWPLTVLNLGQFQMTPCWKSAHAEWSGGGKYSWQWYHFWLVSAFE